MKALISLLLAALSVALTTPASADARRCSAFAYDLQLGQTLIFAEDEKEKKKKKGEETEEEPDCE